MRKKLIIMIIFCMLTGVMVLSGCSNGTSETRKETFKETKAVSTESVQESEAAKTADPEKTHITIGTMSSFQDFIDFLPEKMAEMGYEVEFMVFDDVTTPDIALAEGSIDANFYQHKPYLDAYNEANGTDLYACEPYLIASMDSIISTKYESLEELPDGAKIAISDDASNLSANLHSLEFVGLIKLAEIPEGSYYTIFDVVENPKNLEFVEVPLAQKSAALEDVDAVVTFFGERIATMEGLNVLRVLDDDPVVAFPVIMAVDGKNKDAQWVRDMMEAVAGDEFKAVCDEKNKNYLTWRVLFD